jgi:hypothetical protein
MNMMKQPPHVGVRINDILSDRIPKTAAAMIAAAVLTFEAGRINAKCRMQNAKLRGKTNFFGRAVRAVKCKVQNAKCKI